MCQAVKKHPTDVTSRSVIFFGDQEGLSIIKRDMKAKGQRLQSRLWGEEARLNTAGLG